MVLNYYFSFLKYFREDDPRSSINKYEVFKGMYLELVATLASKEKLIEGEKMVSIIEKLAKDFDGGNLQKVALLENLNLNNQKTMQ